MSKRRINFTIAENINDDLKLTAYLKGTNCSEIIRETIYTTYSEHVNSSLKKIPINCYISEKELSKLKLHKNLSSYLESKIAGYTAQYLREFFKTAIHRNYDHLLGTIYTQRIDNNVYRKLTEKIFEYENINTLFVFDPDNFYSHFGYEYDEKYYIPKRRHQKIYAKGLVNHSSKDKLIQQQDKFAYRATRFLPPGISFQNNFLFFKNAAIILKGNQQEGVLIENALIANKLRRYFEVMYEIAY